MSRFRHMLMMNLEDDVTDVQRAELLATFSRMPQVMDFIRRYEFGFDLGNLDGEVYGFGLVADFDSEDDWRRYSTDSEHEVLAELVRSLSAGMVRMQYLVD